MSSEKQIAIDNTARNIADVRRELSLLWRVIMNPLEFGIVRSLINLFGVTPDGLLNAACIATDYAKSFETMNPYTDILGML